MKIRPAKGEWSSLEHLKRYPSLRLKWSGKKVRIFSEEWRAYWRDDGHGYTSEASEAWVTEFDTAWNCSSHCGPEKQIKYQVV